MLVLTRKQGETIQIGRDVEITVVRLKNNQVRIGVQAPEATTVLRGELVECSDFRVGQIVDESVELADGSFPPS